MAAKRAALDPAERKRQSRESKRRERLDPAKLAQHAEREAIRRAEMTPAERARQAKRHTLTTRYNLTVAEWEQIWEGQGRKCAGCGRKPSPFAKRRYNVDHRHLDGLVRGILCRMCNQGLGYLRDSPAVLASLASYLSNPPASRVLGGERFTKPGPVNAKKRKRRTTRRKKR